MLFEVYVGKDHVLYWFNLGGFSLILRAMTMKILGPLKIIQRLHYEN